MGAVVMIPPEFLWPLILVLVLVLVLGMVLVLVQARKIRMQGWEAIHSLLVLELV